MLRIISIKCFTYFFDNLPVIKYLFKVVNINTRKRFKIRLRLTIKPWTYFPPFKSVSIVDFEYVFVC